MKNNLILLSLILPCLAHANIVSLNALTSNENNFCNQAKDGNIMGILSFLKLNRDSDIVFKGSEVTKIEIKNPQIKLEIDAARLQQESRKYVSAYAAYPFGNLYSVSYFVNFIVDSPIENLKAKMENINSAGVGYKKFGNYNPKILEGSKTMQEFETNLKTIQTAEYSLNLIKNYETQRTKTSVVYQCKMITYTNDSLEEIKQKINN